MKNILKLASVTALIAVVSCKSPTGEETYVKAPFTGIDTIATNDWWNRKSNKILDVKVPREEVVAFGLYTTSKNTLKLSAQLYPLYPEETREVRLELFQNGKWEEVQKQNVHELGWSALFRIENWDMNKTVKYRILHGEKASFEGSIRKNPIDKVEITIAALSCNSNKDRGARENYVRNINHLDPDVVFFAGDQSYDHSEHTAAWLKFGWQFKEVFRNRPCISIPDDHDIGQGNFWGENGKVSETRAGHDGGYFFHPAYVKMVERCQVANLPDAYDPTKIAQGIGVYYTNLTIGKVDFAIVEDRKFKSGPYGKIPQQGPRPDHILNSEYDPSAIDLPGLKLLGDRQLKFIKNWGELNRGKHMKALLSATGFCGGAHLHGKKQTRLHADLDSNGWPQAGRNKALEALKRANGLHIAGDQHLATLVKHGIYEYSDGPWAFVVPAIVNNYYSRWWWPEDEKDGNNSVNGIKWTGDYLDGFNNKISMKAYANPDTESEGAGFGFIRFNTASKKVVFECWPRSVDLTKEGAKQFFGWPVEVQM